MKKITLAAVSLFALWFLSCGDKYVPLTEEAKLLRQILFLMQLLPTCALLKKLAVQKVYDYGRCRK